jgi:hypothetical protein
LPDNPCYCLFFACYSKLCILFALPSLTVAHNLRRACRDNVITNGEGSQGKYS